MDWSGLQKVVICWLATPIGAMLVAIILYLLLGFFLARCPMSILTRDKILWSGLILCGIYGSYALGANNVANVTGIFSGQFTSFGIGDHELALLGGASIALGAVTFGKPVMATVGTAIVPLNAFTGLAAVAAMAITVHFFAVVGVPVSTSQAIVGAIVGIGLMRGGASIRFRTIGRIAIGWISTPLAALILSAAGVAIFE
jgi:PiT family inorganic phosphate transporter